MSSTGGPKTLNGVFDTDANAIKWDDGTVWTKNADKILDCKAHKTHERVDLFLQ